MDPAWVGVIGVLAGVAVTTLGDALRNWLQFRREKRSGWFDERRGRLEEVYVVVEEHKQVYNGLFGEAISSLAGGESTENPKKAVPWGRLQMLINLYAPELKEALGEVHRTASKVGEIALQAMVRPPTDQTAKDRAAAKLVDAFESLSAAYQELLDGVVAASHEIVNESYLGQARLTTDSE